MMMPPNAAPNGAPLSISTAPRPRSDGDSHAEESFAPDGNNGASATPRPSRVASSVIPPGANPASAWNAPQAIVDNVICLRGPNLSIIQPPGT
jgi:hypothetical protein